MLLYLFRTISASEKPLPINCQFALVQESKSNLDFRVYSRENRGMLICTLARVYS